MLFSPDASGATNLSAPDRVKSGEDVNPAIRFLSDESRYVPGYAEKAPSEAFPVL